MLSPRDAALLEAYAKECEDCARAASIEGARANARLSVDIQRTATLKRFVRRLNDTPRKCLDFKTPAEAFSKLKSIVALQT